MNEDREIRLHSIMDQYGVDMDTAEIMLIDEECELSEKRCQ